MTFPINRQISHLIPSQLPGFYESEGPLFVEFVKTYYEWLEQKGQPLGDARRLFETSDIDLTDDEFVEHFQRQYLYGIPSTTLLNRKFLVKHILDLYRAKGSIQGYKLLFRLLYNEDLEIYLPGEDILKPSDGTWVQPTYVEVTDNPVLQSLVGKEVVGASSRVRAVVESYIKEPVNGKIVHTLFLSNVTPKNDSMIVGEKIIFPSQDRSAVVGNMPTILGSLSTLSIVSGGQGFKKGNILKVVTRDPSTGDIISNGTGATVRVTAVEGGSGTLFFDIVKGGTGYTASATPFIFNGVGDTGQGAGFNIGTLSFVQNVTYNTDLIGDYVNLTMNSASYGLTGNTAANLSSTFLQCLSYVSADFGSVASLTGVRSGNGYTQPASVIVRDRFDGQVLPGTVAFNTSSNTVTGTGTAFTSYVSNGDVICLRSVSADPSTNHHYVVSSVANATSLSLMSKPTSNSTGTSVYLMSPEPLKANFAAYEPAIKHQSPISGEDLVITAVPSFGTDVVASVKATNSGKGYLEGELVSCYLTAPVTQPVISHGGLGYSNGDFLVFSGGGTSALASGFVTTDANGTVTAAVVTDFGSGYTSPPVIKIKTMRGTGAVLSCGIGDLNTSSIVQGRVVKGGQGSRVGYWSTTRGFLNSDKYIQDSFFYQDFSYQLKTPISFATYKDVVNKVFHATGNELFGKYDRIMVEDSSVGILYEDGYSNSGGDQPPTNLSPPVITGYSLT